MEKGGFIAKGKGIQSREKSLVLGIGFSSWPWAAQPSDIRGDIGDLFITFFCMAQSWEQLIMHQREITGDLIRLVR